MRCSVSPHITGTTPQIHRDKIQEKSLHHLLTVGKLSGNVAAGSDKRTKPGSKGKPKKWKPLLSKDKIKFTREDGNDNKLSVCVVRHTFRQKTPNFLSTL